MIRLVAILLRRMRVRHAVIGGIAASVWGRPRMTLDADVVIAISPQRISELLTALETAGFRVNAPAQHKLERGLAAKIRYKSNISLDLRVASYTLDKKAISEATQVKLFGEALRVARPEDTIVYKIARFNDIDKADIKNIMARMGSKLDSDYIREASKTLSDETGDLDITKNADTVLTWIK